VRLYFPFFSCAFFFPARPIVRLYFPFFSVAFFIPAGPTCAPEPCEPLFFLFFCAFILVRLTHVSLACCCARLMLTLTCLLFLCFHLVCWTYVRLTHVSPYFSFFSCAFFLVRLTHVSLACCRAQVMWVEQLPPGLARDHRRRCVDAFRRALFGTGSNPQVRVCVLVFAGVCACMFS